MVISSRCMFMAEMLSNLPVSAGRLALLPEEPGHAGMLEEGKEVSNHFSAHVPESWPPTVVEPATKDAIGWTVVNRSRIRCAHPRSADGVRGCGERMVRGARFWVLLIPFEQTGSQDG
jgi:hypothetical protein